MEAERVAPLDYWPDAEESDEGWQSEAAPTVLSAVRPVELAHPAADTAPKSGQYSGFGKRTFDLVVGIPLFLASVPVIAVAAIAIGVTSGWPVFYKTRRLGANGREFTMWKLRSMVKNADQVLADWRVSNPQLAAEYEASFKLKQDPRITAVGRVIRRTSIDELPQFWNVLRGEMSLVGPRPYYAHELEPHPLAYKSIIKVRPGVTGAWQVAGRNSLSPAERMFIDRTYVNTCCFRTDVDLLLKTVRTLLRPNGY